MHECLAAMFVRKLLASVQVNVTGLRIPSSNPKRDVDMEITKSEQVSTSDPESTPETKAKVAVEGSESPVIEFTPVRKSTKRTHVTNSTTQSKGKKSNKRRRSKITFDHLKEPTPRWGHAIVSLGSSSRFMLFGGQNDRGVSKDVQWVCQPGNEGRRRQSCPDSYLHRQILGLN